MQEGPDRVDEGEGGQDEDVALRGGSGVVVAGLQGGERVERRGGRGRLRIGGQRASIKYGFCEPSVCAHKCYELIIFTN